MDNNSKKDELQVEQYDAAKAEAKRKKILLRVGIGIGAAVLLAVLGYFGLVAFRELFMNKPPVNELPINELPMNEFYLGGNGAWFNSKVIFLEDASG